MVDPINYSGLLTQVNLAPLREGIQLRQQKQIAKDQIAERQQTRQLAQAKFEYDHQKDVDYLEAVKNYQLHPSAQALRDLAIRFPDKASDLLKAGDSYNRAQKQSLVEATSGTLGALAAGKNDLAIKTLTDRATALEGSGIDTSHTQSAIDMIKAGNVKGATAYLSYVMSGLVGADHTAGIMDSLGIGGKAEDRRIDNERADRALAIQQQRADTADRRAESSDARAERREARADAREARLARGGSAASGNYEYRIDPATGAVQRRKRQ